MPTRFVARNETRNELLADRAERADAVLARLKGLLGRDGLGAGEGLHIVPCNSIHTFFMRFPIDVLFLDADGVVIRALDRVVPWRATRIYGRAASVLELPDGVLRSTGTLAGDRVSFLPLAGA